MAPTRVAGRDLLWTLSALAVAVLAVGGDRVLGR
jgi:hypothetical protein